MATKKTFNLRDSLDQEVKAGDWVSYLEPGSRSLSIAPVVGGTEKSLRILRLQIDKPFLAKNGPNFRAEETITRQFEICVKVEAPIGVICTYKNQSMFCNGVNASALGKTLQMAIDEARNIPCHFYGYESNSNRWAQLSGSDAEEIRDQGIAEGWNWHQKFIVF